MPDTFLNTLTMGCVLCMEYERYALARDCVGTKGKNRETKAKNRETKAE
jgi:hypothetical protein